MQNCFALSLNMQISCAIAAAGVIARNANWEVTPGEHPPYKARRPLGLLLYVFRVTLLKALRNCRVLSACAGYMKRGTWRPFPAKQFYVFLVVF